MFQVTAIIKIRFPNDWLIFFCEFVFSFSLEVVAEGNGEIEGVEKKLKYPFSVFFIISNEFCERFNYYGMRSMKIKLTRFQFYWHVLISI